MELRMRVLADGDIRSRAEAADALADDLQRAGIALQPEAVESSPGAKSGTALAIGEWAVKGLLSAATLNALAQIVVAFVQRGAARSVVLVVGDDRLEVTGADARDLRRLIEAWLAKHSG